MASSVTQKAMFSAVTTLVVFGSAEMGLMAAGWPQPTGRFKHNQVYWVSDANLERYDMAHREVAGSFQVTTDDNGIRYPLHEVDKRPGTWRIMPLGCSTTFGWGVDDPDSYPARLEVLARASGHPDTEVINGGQPGYTSFQGTWLWDETLKYYTPDVVVIGYVVQDSRKAEYSDRSQAILQRDSLPQRPPPASLPHLPGAAKLDRRGADRGQRNRGQRPAVGSTVRRPKTLWPTCAGS